ncbi:hypothetical protein QFW77_11820 [Luteimonas sp. RD2P54]|uniref:Uncharacterized protein n=1 Tax=Luteimonas endophytica TaxID=3042023 RepID=A0ABT6JA31_9GAMM|nr:hypothetical protein [Luteimonas endophytica]MDH5823674.1 hypothetical protein [Luteimonas endophytica]
MRIQPVAAVEAAAGEMDLPDPLERQPGERLAHRLPAVALVDPQVVQVEQQAAVGTARDFGDELAVGELAGARAQVVDVVLDRDRYAQSVRHRAEVGGGLRGALRGLHRRQQGARVDPALWCRHRVEAEVLARPGRPQRGDHLAHQAHAPGIGRERAAHRRGHAMHQLALRQCGQLVQYPAVHPHRLPRVPGLEPEEFGLDLDPAWKRGPDGTPDREAAGARLRYSGRPSRSATDTA